VYVVAGIDPGFGQGPWMFARPRVIRLQRALRALGTYVRDSRLMVPVTGKVDLQTTVAVNRARRLYVIFGPRIWRLRSLSVRAVRARAQMLTRLIEAEVGRRRALFVQARQGKVVPKAVTAPAPVPAPGQAPPRLPPPGAPPPEAPGLPPPPAPPAPPAAEGEEAPAEEAPAEEAPAEEAPAEEAPAEEAPAEEASAEGETAGFAGPLGTGGKIGVGVLLLGLAGGIGYGVWRTFRK